MPILETIESKPFHHITTDGTQMSIERCDLDGILTIIAPNSFSEEQIARSICEMMVWHSKNVVPQLFNQQSCYIKEVIIKRKP